MLSQHMLNTARSFAGLGADPDGSVTIKAETFNVLADGLFAMAEQAAELERHVVPCFLRGRPELVGDNVIPFSKPWGGHPPGSDRGPDSGGDAA